MNYILATESNIIEYPYSVEKLRSDNPQTSFPVVMTDSELAEWGVYSVTEEPAPSFNEANEQLEKAEPRLVNGVWSVGWIVSQASAEEINRRFLLKAASIRKERNQGLAASDHTQLPDWPEGAIEKAKWAELRQKLRDIPQTAGFPWSIEWPIIDS
ncbi:MAG: hypothetical protein EBS18_05780 [Actinobacteria bacterium]|nr:hypothetical protein [Actinomycetota bacterium]